MSRLAEVQRATIAMVYVCGDVEQRAVISRIVAGMMWSAMMWVRL